MKISMLLILGFLCNMSHAWGQTAYTTIMDRIRAELLAIRQYLHAGQ